MATALQEYPKYNRFEVVKSGRLTTNNSASSAIVTTTVPHNLGFTPLPIVFWGDVTTNFVLPAWFAVSIGSPDLQFSEFISCAVDKVNLYIYDTQAIGFTNAGFEITYYLCRLRAGN